MRIESHFQNGWGAVLKTEFNFLFPVPMKVTIICTEGGVAPSEPRRFRLIICSCHGVNDRALDTIVDDGAHTLRQVGDACGAGTDCGACCRDILARLKQRTSISSESPDEERAPLSK